MIVGSYYLLYYYNSYGLYSVSQICCYYMLTDSIYGILHVMSLYTNNSGLPIAMLESP